MRLKILAYPDPVLRRHSVEVREVTDELRSLAADMAETMYETDGIGLAAPQVGRSIRFVVVDVTGPERREDLRVLVNPVVTPDASAGLSEYEEGCLSVPDFRSRIKRPARVHVSAKDLDGRPVEFDAEGLLATCVQHEVDHLDGRLFIDHMSYLKRTIFEKKARRKG